MQGFFYLGLCSLNVLAGFGVDYDFVAGFHEEWSADVRAVFQRHDLAAAVCGVAFDRRGSFLYFECYFDWKLNANRFFFLVIICPNERVDDLVWFEKLHFVSNQLFFELEAV